MMKKLLIIMIFLMVGLCYPKGNITTSTGFWRAVRLELNIDANAMLPDTVLAALSQRGILWTSSDIGGIQMGFWLATVEEQVLYAVPDSVTEIVSATTIRDLKTRDIRGGYPPFYEATYDMTFYEAPSEDAVPLSYSLWDDSVQLFPIPIQDDDSIYFKFHIEHPVCTAGATTILLKSAYVEAAIDYTCYLVYKRLQMYDIATYYEGQYGKKKQDLRQRYAPKIDLLKREE
jgi:hypothetical protein